MGLDSYVGFLHRDRPGRTSLALDLMEELRPCFADRFVLTMINNRVMQPSDFEQAEDGAVRMTDDARRKFLKSWPGAQARDHYPPLSWGEDALGTGAVYAGPAAQSLPPGRFGRLSTVFVEMRRDYDGADYL